jgi:hypothetical protein
MGCRPARDLRSVALRELKEQACQSKGIDAIRLASPSLVAVTPNTGRRRSGKRLAARSMKKAGRPIMIDAKSAGIPKSSAVRPSGGERKN